MNKRFIFTILLSAAVAMPALAQKPDKAFEDIVAGVKAKDRQPAVDDNMNKARATLEKILSKDANNAMANTQFVGIARHGECRYLCHHKQNNRQT